jgi:hypothetical protein
MLQGLGTEVSQVVPKAWAALLGAEYLSLVRLSGYQLRILGKELGKPSPFGSQDLLGP